MAELTTATNGLSLLRSDESEESLERIGLTSLWTVGSVRYKYLVKCRTTQDPEQQPSLAYGISRNTQGIS